MIETENKLSERIIVPNMKFGSETWGMRHEERNKVHFAEIQCLRNMGGATRWDRIIKAIYRTLFPWIEGGLSRW